MSYYPAAIKPTFTRLQASAVLTLLEDIDGVVLGTEPMPEEFWCNLNAAAQVLTAELWAGIEQASVQ